jgi:N-acetylmuramoyl-L-alanine amidase
VSGFEKAKLEAHDLVSQVRIGTPDRDKLRVAFDLTVTQARTEVVVLENPYRIVIDINRPEATEAPAPKVRKKPMRPVVVLDPGHGGKDSGALGHGGAREKTIALQLSKAVEKILEKDGVDAVLTRDDDSFLSLEERTARANRLDADIFVSIHANAHDDDSIEGIETYYLDVTNNRYALRLAAVENKVREERVSEIQLALAELSSRLFTEESSELAKSIQSRLVATSRKVRQTRDLGVKSSLFYVLLGTRMPAVLVEAGFISHPKEQAALASAAHQAKLARAIADGIMAHLEAKRKGGS